MQTDSKEVTHLLVGYALIALGVLIMLLSCFQVYRVFTRQAEPMHYFNFPGIKIDLTKLAPQVDTSSLDALKKQFNLGVGSSQPTAESANATEILPAEVLNEPANLGVFLLFMGFLLSFGSKLADLGIKLVRPVYVKG
ncbi:hypothetical protein KBB12_04105 [Candidatus Woesebacteria bacterium]|nr:hypothetical protein [Candidatus Woesebacteria bacterium]